MPKKRAPTYDTKPKSPAHPALSSSGKPKDAHSLGSVYSSTGNSVNDRLQHLRISHGTSSAGAAFSNVLNANANPSLPPSIRTILQLEDAPPPRPRPGLRVTGRTRGIAGPVPPSWLRRREPGAGRQVKIGNLHEEGKRVGFESLPGSFTPDDGSLMATALRGLAEDWKWHVVYDQFYLATLPVRYKAVLLNYISRYNPHSLDKSGLGLLFLDETELEDATGAEGLTHLDLSTSIGQYLKLSELKEFFRARRAQASGEAETEMLRDDWDATDFSGTPSSLPRFHTLTHLSLSQPNGLAIWKGLLDLAPHLTTLTHLALAYWPTPSLSPNSTTAYRETPQGSVNYGASNLYSAYDNDWSEAASLLRRLGKSTYCLKWLDLTGCYPWVQALADVQVDWCGAWQALLTVKIGQGWIPRCFQEGADEKMWQEWRRESRLLQPSPRSIALQNWAKVEHDTIQVQDKVNARIMRSFRGEEAAHETPRPHDADWSDAPRTGESTGLKSGNRSTRVVFERGWDAWWIRNAIEQAYEVS
ncbi:hypothetical protein P7C71_g398, partial [Lecanoromycetidae sp. Uapishka_2]